MNIYQYTLSALLALTSSITNAQSMSDAELIEFVIEKFNTSSFYNEEAMKLMGIHDDPNRINTNAIIQNFCKSNKALADVKMIATQYPQIPHDIVDQANTNYQSGIRNINQLNALNSNKIECNE